MRYDCIKFKRIRNLTWSEYYNLQICITAQKIKLRIWSHLLKKSLMENFIFYEVHIPAAKRVQIRTYFTPYLTLFSLNTEIYSLILCIQSEQRKIKIKVYSTSEFVICRQNKFSFSNMIKALISINLSLFTCKT